MDLCGVYYPGPDRAMSERRARVLSDRRAGAKRRTRPEASWNMPADRRVVVPSEPASPPQGLPVGMDASPGSAVRGSSLARGARFLGLCGLLVANKRASGATGPDAHAVW